MPHRFINGNINGISYGFIETGNSSGSVLIFLPGIGAYKESYIDHILAFQEYYSGMYIIDLPEQGSKGCWQIGVMAENLAEFIRNIDTPGIRRIDLAGHSAGALAIISFMVNYNSRAEERFSEAVRLSDPQGEARLAVDTDGTGFAGFLPEMSKVDRLLLYAPPDSFNYVFDRVYSGWLAKRSEEFVRRLLNTLVNRPMLLLGFFSRSPYFRFRTGTSGRPQYFNLVLNDYVRFLNYTSDYMTVFEIYRMGDQPFRDKIIERLEGKRILIQYGSSDWLLKPYRKRTAGFSEGLKITPGVRIKRHPFLGHMLNHRFRPDINLNARMVMNRKVTDESIRFINE